ncbi:MAG: envelope stress response membrane protein PspC [Alphaproteobacteria bacterium]|nr:MAG: envelope stress response membrane protein PspC [Alphaproteobacteria bacterium]
MTTPSRTKFYLDKQNKKWMGVCAGIADYTGFDVTLVRIAVAILTVVGAGGFVVPAYFIAGWIAPTKPREFVAQSPEQTKFWQGVRTSPKRTVRDVRSRFREIDRRLADVEIYVTSSNGRLAREIEELR